MNLVGGYQIIDFKNYDLSKGNFTIPGIYDLIEGTNKVLLITGITIDEIEQNDVYVSKQTIGSDFIINLYGYTLYIQDNDVITKKMKKMSISDNIIPRKNGIYEIIFTNENQKIISTQLDYVVFNMEYFETNQYVQKIEINSYTLNEGVDISITVSEDSPDLSFYCIVKDGIGYLVEEA